MKQFGEKNTNVAFISIWKVAWCNIKAAISIEINFASLWKDSFLKILIVSYTIRVAITFSPLLHRAVLPLSATNQPPIRPRRLLLPNRACFAPIVNSFTCVCYILKAFLWAHCSQNNFFSQPTTVTRVAADSVAASTALQPLLILDVIALFEFELSLIS